MKKAAHRILALIVALSVFLLPAAALAEERNAAALTIGNLEITIDDETITLPVALTLSGAVDIENARGALGAALSTSEATALSAMATLENGEIRAMLDGMGYGLYATLESIVALIEESTGMTMDEMIASLMEEVSSEMPTDIMNGINSVPAELIAAAEAAEAVSVEPQQICDALGLTMTDAIEASYSFFDEEIAASLVSFSMESKTLADCVDAVVALDPAYAEFWKLYEEFLNEMLASEGEEITIDDVLSIVAIGLDGDAYTNEDGTAVAVEMFAPLTAEGETVDTFFSLVALEAEEGVYADIGLEMNVDGETAYFSVYADSTSVDGVDSWSIMPVFGVMDAETETSELEALLTIVGSSSEDAVRLSFGVFYSEYDDTTSFSIDYAGDRGVFGETDAYTGELSLTFDTAFESIAVTLDTALELSTLPEGDLLTLPEGSIDIMPVLTEGNEEVLSQLSSDAQIALMQGLGVLMQDPTLAEMLSGLMG